MRPTARAIARRPRSWFSCVSRPLEELLLVPRRLASSAGVPGTDPVEEPPEYALRRRGRRALVPSPARSSVPTNAVVKKSPAPGARRADVSPVARLPIAAAPPPPRPTLAKTAANARRVGLIRNVHVVHRRVLVRAASSRASGNGRVRDDGFVHRRRALAASRAAEASAPPGVCPGAPGCFRNHRRVCSRHASSAQSMDASSPAACATA